jgi:hypothetical protein
MLIKSHIPKTIYRIISPFIPISSKKEQLRSSPQQDSSSWEHSESPEKGTLVQQGRNQHQVNQAQKKESQKEMVDKMVRKSNRLIISISSFSLIPFDLFINRIDVEESRVTFVFKQPFTYQSHSVDIMDISNVFIDSAFLFANMQVVSRTFTQNNITIGYLNKRKADKVRRVIEGLRTFAHENIDTSVYDKTELIQQLEELHLRR